MSEPTPAVTPPNGTGAAGTNIILGSGGSGGSGTPPTPATPPTPPPAIETVSMPKDAFDERLTKAGAAATRKLLKDLGYDKPEDLQSALGTLKKLQDDQLTEIDRSKKRIKELEPFEVQAKEYAGIVATMVEEQFKALPEAVQQAIDEVAEGNARERLRLMKVMKAAGVGATQATPPTPPAPKTLAPNGGPAPAPAGGKTKFQEWDELRKVNPVRASLFFQLHGQAIEASRPADQQ